MIVRNWNDTARCEPARAASPRTVAELTDIVQDTARYPSPVRAVGQLHSLNACFTTSGTLVRMDHFRDIGPPEHGTITVGAGVRLIDLRDALKPWGLQLEVTPEIGNATAGSVACCGTKDSSLGARGLGQVSSTVTAVRLVDARGTPVHVTDPARLREIRSSYGLLGVVYEVTFSTQALLHVSYRYEWLRLEPLPSLEHILGGADGFLGFLLPYLSRLLVERRTRLPQPAPIGWRDWMKDKVRDLAWEHGASLFTTWMPTNWWFSVFDRLLYWVFVWPGLIGSFHGDRVDSMLDFDRRRPDYFDFTFWAIPVSRWRVVIPAYLAFCREHLARTGFRPALPTEIYLIRQDAQSRLSFSAAEDIFTLDMVDCRPRPPGDDARWRAMNREFNRFVASHGGRPLLNQTKELTGPVVARALGDDWRAFAALVQKEDPAGRFLSDYFRELLAG